MKSAITFHCQGRTNRSEMHTIVVSGRRVQCSCQGVDWCSHIDATLIAGERHMVPAEDRPAADRAMRIMRGILQPPADWQASWREDKVWRGLAPPRSDIAARIRWEGRPTICFLGSGEDGPRSEYVEQAESLGWKVIETPNAYTTLVVSSIEGLATRRGEIARDLNLPIIDHSQWMEWQYDFTNEIMNRIEAFGIEPGPTRRNVA